MLLLVAGALGALIDIALHVLQLWPRLVPSHKTVQYLTIGSGVLMVASCTVAPNPGALVMGLGLIGMTLFSMVTGRELD